MSEGQRRGLIESLELLVLAIVLLLAYGVSWGYQKYHEPTTPWNVVDQFRQDRELTSQQSSAITPMVTDWLERNPDLKQRPETLEQYLEDWYQMIQPEPNQRRQ